MKREQLNDLKNSTKYIKHFYHKKVSICVINNKTKTIFEKSEGTFYDVCDLVDWLEQMTDTQLKKYDVHIEMMENNLEN